MLIQLCADTIPGDCGLLTICTAIWVAVSGDCDSLRIAMICCRPSPCGSHVILLLLQEIEWDERVWIKIWGG